MNQNIDITHTEPLTIPPIQSVTLDTNNGAELYAEAADSVPLFFVSFEKEDCKPGKHGAWAFDTEACQDAIDFFTTLKADLEEKEAVS